MLSASSALSKATAAVQLSAIISACAERFSTRDLRTVICPHITTITPTNNSALMDVAMIMDISLCFIAIRPRRHIINPSLSPTSFL